MTIDEIEKHAEYAIMEMKTRLAIYSKEAESQGLDKIEHIKARVKSTESIKEKVEKKGLEYNPENVKTYIRDIAGIRAVVLFEDDIYSLYEYIMSQEDLVVTRVKDYVKCPKKSGYRSLHMNIIVPVCIGARTEKIEIELQIRTVAMDFFATIEHKLKYKSDTNISNDISQELKLCSEIIKDLDKKMYNIDKRLRV